MTLSKTNRGVPKEEKIMEHLEMVEKLREKTGASYEDAKAALEACEWDMLDAVVYLEKLGKISGPAVSYTTQYEQTKQFVEASTTHSKKGGFGEVLNDFFGWCGEMIKKGNENFLHVEKEDHSVVTMPMTVFVLLLIFAFWVVVPLMIVGLFFGFKYHFSGNIEKLDLNDAMNKVSKAAEDIKNDFAKKDNE